ncbi:hypothetical protein GB931_13660 [Modestobacter sp. I12A-02628]|uniref:Uncharacterized protein n=1 Tax=Goekera deserti TaxID=2497753 RepID=A0A7K3WJH0_9ACTN|nr:hypothetical protein [Goekera deserti]MPQ98949.1 hypothetical protein [Goekera deserti]NDI49551.1 hypothetical protein [Goekera deserti]NEL56658.1 hypothetical protein [Goekera deserti]
MSTTESCTLQPVPAGSASAAGVEGTAVVAGGAPETAPGGSCWTLPGGAGGSNWPGAVVAEVGAGAAGSTTAAAGPAFDQTAVAASRPSASRDRR